jgi:hypothetical protein
MGTLYYVSGWLQPVNKTKKGQVLPDSALRQQFVSANGSRCIAAGIRAGLTSNK